jgi:outer membrane protein assembly factor BamB
MRKWVLLSGAIVLAVAAGLTVAFVLVAQREDPGRLDTKLSGVSYEGPAQAPPAPPKKYVRLPYHLHSRSEQPCWNQFGSNTEHTLARLDLDLGPPTKPVWARALNGYIEYPPVYCDGLLYVNTFRGMTYAVDSETGATVWQHAGAHKPSSPAIAGRRVLVSANDGTLTAYDRFSGRRLWRIHTGARVESSPAVVDDTAFIGNANGRVFAVDVARGRIRWAFDTGATINSSPMVHGGLVCVTNYAGAVFCLRKGNGQKVWSTYLKRDPFRYESFYASASTDGRRLYTIARSGRVVALSLATGKVDWSKHINAWGYSTPALAPGLVLVGGFDGALHAYRASSGDEVWASHVGGRILGAPVVIGPLVLFATLEEHAYAARLADGKVVWSWKAGKYSPAIATNRHYYFSLNGLLAAFRAQRSPLECNPNESRALSARERAACHKVYRAQAAARREAAARPARR